MIVAAIFLRKQNSVWLHLHSLQLIVYLILLDDPYTPGNVSLYLKQYLNVLRMSSPDITIATVDGYDESRNSNGSDESRVIESGGRDTLLQQSGYVPFFFSNSPILFSFLALGCFVWVLAALKNSPWVPY